MRGLRDALEQSEKNGVAIGHFNVADWVLLKAVLASGLARADEVIERALPADRLSLHVRPRLGRGVQVLLFLGRQFQWYPDPSQSSRCDIYSRFARSVGQDQHLQEAHGLELPMGLSYGSDFNFDYHVSFTPEEIAEGKAYYNYGIRLIGASDEQGISIFWNVRMKSVGTDLMRRCRCPGFVGFWRVPSRAHPLVSSGTCRICSHAV